MSVFRRSSQWLPPYQGRSGHTRGTNGYQYGGESLESRNIPEQHNADTVFSQLISHCESLQSSSPFKKVTLIRLSDENSWSNISSGTFSSLSMMTCHRLYAVLDQWRKSGSNTFLHLESIMFENCHKINATMPQVKVDFAPAATVRLSASNKRKYNPIKEIRPDELSKK